MVKQDPKIMDESLELIITRFMRLNFQCQLTLNFEEMKQFRNAFGYGLNVRL